MVKVKVCGITNIEDALKAVYYGAYALGFIFYKKSPRYVSPSKARKIIEALPPFITPVGVFVDQKERAVMDVCRFTRINTVQFHGDEKPVYCKRFKDFKIIKAFRVGSVFFADVVKKYKVDAYLFDAYQEDAYGGTGKKFNWDIICKEKFDKPIILSGGLNPDNVKEAIGQVNPFAVDVSSSLETAPGIKNPRLIRSFFENINSF
ncbi:MAG: phosphoribosylanthranilate isomerase [Candidatus Omnitrophica bacterium]|nr:phosphoribosylanthranilate isomerase [Candidatus Omnitrophota bacterium]MBU1995672.1 phosphoribosylanthranilate isomerase [Candidatus Omnitrophota bacterium]MBU4334010.1 phosphoribosylanthranilate isomerase [Candidatus Omnitrophota bacterium]